MTINGNWERSYSPAEAERGKFIQLDDADLTLVGYPSSGRGKYALLTYQTNPVELDLSGLVVSVSGLNISEPLTVSVGNTTQASAVDLAAGVPRTMAFSPKVYSVEIYNNDSTNLVYLSWSALTMANLSAQGLPLAAGAYYSLDRETTQLTIGSLATANVRIFGHYEV